MRRPWLFSIATMWITILCFLLVNIIAARSYNNYNLNTTGITHTFVCHRPFRKFCGHSDVQCSPWIMRTISQLLDAGLKVQGGKIRSHWLTMVYLKSPFRVIIITLPPTSITSTFYATANQDYFRTLTFNNVELSTPWPYGHDHEPPNGRPVNGSPFVHSRC